MPVALNNTTQNINGALTRAFCTTRWQELHGINNDNKIMALVLIATFALIGLTINSFVVYMLIVTKQLENRSFRLIFYETMMEMLFNMASVCKCFIISMPYKLPCQFLVAERFIGSLAMYATRYMICLVAIDRYMRIKYQHEYEIKFTTFWYRTMLSIYAIAVLYQSLVCVMAKIYQHKSGWLSKLTLPINAVALAVFIILYIKSYIILNIHSRTNRTLSNTDNDIVRITKYYFILYLISNSLLFASSTINIIVLKDSQSFADDGRVAVNIANNLNSTMAGIITSIVLLNINRAIKQKLSSCAVLPWHLNRVAPQNNDS